MTASDLAKCPNCQGCRITVVLHTECRVPWRDVGLCPDCNGSGYVKRPEETDEQFKARVAEKLRPFPVDPERDDRMTRETKK